MKALLLIVSILLIAIVLLQSSKAETASLNGTNDALFKNRKERGGELFITRLTAVLGVIFFAICIALSYF